MLDASVAALFPNRVCGVIRWSDSGQALQAALVAARSGLGSVEVTLGTPTATALVSQLRSEGIPGCSFGVGTVTSARDAAAAIESGAQFLVSPYLVPEAVKEAVAAGVPFVMGATTPTEIARAEGFGAKLIKVFPAAPVGGPAYIRTVRGPMPRVPLWVSGGVTIAAAADYLEAGADVIGLTNDLFTPELLSREDWTGLERRCLAALEAVGTPTAPILG